MASVEAPQFDARGYLEQRVLDPSFVMVEIGYGQYPLVAQQPHSFTGQQAYIGIEAGMWGLTLAQRNAAHFRKEHTDINAFFLFHRLGKGFTQGDFKHPGDFRYDGEYDANTILPDNAADEIVASNVFCDPLIANSKAHTATLLDEMARLVGPGGTVVLRETLTPSFVRHIHEGTLAHAGLSIVQRLNRPDHSGEWEGLEQVYGTHHLDDRPPDINTSYYLFLKNRSESGGQA